RLLRCGPWRNPARLPPPARHHEQPRLPAHRPGPQRRRPPGAVDPLQAVADLPEILDRGVQPEDEGPLAGRGPGTDADTGPTGSLSWHATSRSTWAPRTRWCTPGVRASS